MQYYFNILWVEAYSNNTVCNASEATVRVVFAKDCLTKDCLIFDLKEVYLVQSFLQRKYLRLHH
jgi:hypothetical protein